MPILRIRKRLTHRLNGHQQLRRKERMAKTGNWRMEMARENAKTRGAAVMAHNYIERTRVRINRLTYLVGAQAVALVALVLSAHGITLADALVWAPTVGAFMLALLGVYLVVRVGYWIMGRVRRTAPSGEAAQVDTAAQS